MQGMTAHAKTARHLTVRNVSPELARALQEEKQRRGESLNQVVLDLLSQGLGVGAGRRRSNGLAELAKGLFKMGLEHSSVVSGLQ